MIQGFCFLIQFSINQVIDSLICTKLNLPNYLSHLNNYYS
ncbi:MAG: hypothetical protein RJA07_12 [Bacteroidota bacterium]|jgi:hypothetical protein